MSENKQSRLPALRDFQFMGIPLAMYAVICVILWVSMGFGWLGNSYFTLFAFLLSIALPLRWIGDHTPFLGKYVGFGPLLTIFGPSVLVLVGYITPEMQADITELRDNVLNPTNIAMLMCGAVLGRLDRKLLMKAILRYIPVLILSMFATIGVACLVGPLLGYDLFNSLVVYSFPIFSGGSSGPLVSIPAMLNEAGVDGDALIGIMVAAMSLANVEAIVLSGVLDAVGRVKPSWTGNGNLVRTGKQIEVNTEHAKFDGKISSLFTGVFFGAVLFAVSNVIANLTSSFINLNYIVWLIILCIVIKIVNIVPQRIIDCLAWASDLVTGLFLPAMMVCVGITAIDLTVLADAMSIKFFLMVTCVILTFVIAAGIFGRLFGMYPIESAISIGCCSCDIGGTGDLVNCQVSKRMDLFPFASISTRLGGALALLVLGVLIPMLV